MLNPETPIGGVTMKKITIILSLLMIVFLTSCSSGTIKAGFKLNSSGSSNTTFVPTILGISASSNALIEEPVSVTFLYGHNSTEDDHGQYVRKDIFEITLIFEPIDGTEICMNGVCNTVLSYDNIVVYNQEVFNLYLESNRVSIINGLFSDKIKFPSSFDLDIDFNSVPFETGLIVFKLYEFMTFSEDENESLMVGQTLYFEIKDDQVHFSLTKTW